MIRIQLTQTEIAYLFRQNPETKKNGGFQELLVILQEHFDPPSGMLMLDDDLRNRILRYKGSYGTGGYQSRLKKIFGRTLLN